MALNFSHRPIFPARLSEDNLVSPMRIANGFLMEGIPERGGDGFASPWHSNRDVEDCFDYGTGRDRGDRSGSPESVSKDIIDLLPSDPFGMDISTTVTALTGWLEDLEVDYGGYGRDNGGNSRGEYELFAAGLNFIWNKAVQFQAFPGNVHCGDKSNTVYQSNGCAQEKREANAIGQAGFGQVPVVQDVMNFADETASSSAGRGIHESCAVAENCSDGDSGAPHPALFFALGFLGVRDLLLVERVCSSFCSTVRGDPLLWRRIHIGQPLNERITDDVLLQLTSRAQGNLQCLSLLECPRITDDGLKRVLESNPRLTKLSVPGCTRLSIEGIVNNLKALKSKVSLGIKHLRIGGRYGITDEQFEELKLLLGTDIHIEEKAHKPRFYHGGNHYLSCDDNRAIDIEICPKCQKLRLVYDCPAEGCQEKADASQACRACKLCIPRCVQCGHCISDSEYEETFCLEWLCSGCSNRLPKRADSRDVVHGHSENIILQEPDCNYCFHG